MSLLDSDGLSPRRLDAAGGLTLASQCRAHGNGYAVGVQA